MNFYICEACRYCFESENLPNRCPDCGAVEYNDKKAVRSASNNEIEELLRIRADDKDDAYEPH